MVDGEADLVEILARKMSLALGQNPDELVPETGRPDASLIPAWMLEREHAIRFLAAEQYLESCLKDTRPSFDTGEFSKKLAS